MYSASRPKLLLPFLLYLYLSQSIVKNTCTASNYHRRPADLISFIVIVTSDFLQVFFQSGNFSCMVIPLSNLIWLSSCLGFLPGRQCQTASSPLGSLSLPLNAWHILPDACDIFGSVSAVTTILTHTRLFLAYFCQDNIRGIIDVLSWLTREA